MLFTSTARTAHRLFTKPTTIPVYCQGQRALRHLARQPHLTEPFAAQMPLKQTTLKRGHSTSPENQPHRMTKRTKRVDEVSDPQKPQDKSRNSIYETPGIVATAQAAAEADADPPLKQLNGAISEQHAATSTDSNGDAVVYWMRMEDIRLSDNRALSAASELAKANDIPLLVLFIFSVGDYKAHDRSPRRIDFVLRNLRVIQKDLAEMHIPLYTITHLKRKTVPEKVIELLKGWNAQDVFGNVEYEVDELRRDLKLMELAKGAGIGCTLLHDRCAVEPGEVLTKDGHRTPAVRFRSLDSFVPLNNHSIQVYSPWLRTWTSVIQSHPECLREAPAPSRNNSNIHKNKAFEALFEHKVPDYIAEYECGDADYMAKLWPAGTDAAKQVIYCPHSSTVKLLTFHHCRSSNAS